MDYINYIQLKVARRVLNLGVRDIGSLIELSRTTVSNLENNIINLKDIRLAERRNAILKEFFKVNNIIFPNNHTISFISHSIINSLSQNGVINRFQFKASRIILNETHADFAKSIGLSTSAVTTLEKGNNEKIIKFRSSLSQSNLINKLKTHSIKLPDNFSVSFCKNLLDG